MIDLPDLDEETFESLFPISQAKVSSQIPKVCLTICSQQPYARSTSPSFNMPNKEPSEILATQLRDIGTYISRWPAGAIMQTQSVFEAVYIFRVRVWSRSLIKGWSVWRFSSAVFGTTWTRASPRPPHTKSEPLSFKWVRYSSTAFIGKFTRPRINQPTRASRRDGQLLTRPEKHWKGDLHLSVRITIFVAPCLLTCGYAS